LTLHCSKRHGNKPAWRSHIQRPHNNGTFRKIISTSSTSFI